MFVFVSLFLLLLAHCFRSWIQRELYSIYFCLQLLLAWNSYFSIFSGAPEEVITLLSLSHSTLNKAFFFGPLCMASFPLNYPSSSYSSSNPFLMNTAKQSCQVRCLCCLVQCHGCSPTSTKAHCCMLPNATARFMVVPCGSTRSYLITSLYEEGTSVMGLVDSKAK